MFRDDATVGEANEMLAAIDARIVGGIRGTADLSGILFLRLGTESHEEMEVAIDFLRSDPRVRSAAPDVLLASDWIPRPSLPSAAAWEWKSDPGAALGTWGHVLVRVPQAWNLVPAIRKEGVDVQVGVLDTGFLPHEDLAYLNLTPDIPGDEHGTSVASIIGARFDNGLGTDGINPRAKLVVRYGAHFGADASVHSRRSWGGHVLEAMKLMLEEAPTIRVVNVSMSYRWYTADIDPEAELDASRIAEEHGQQAQQLLDLLQTPRACGTRP